MKTFICSLVYDSSRLMMNLFLLFQLFIYSFINSFDLLYILKLRLIIRLFHNRANYYCKTCCAGTLNQSNLFNRCICRKYSQCSSYLIKIRARFVETQRGFPTVVYLGFQKGGRQMFAGH